MHLTAQQLRDLGYVERDGQLYKAHNPIPHPVSKRHEAATLGRADEGKASSTRRIGVRFTLYRNRPLDPDNAAGSVKDLLDGLRRAALIPEDDWHTIKLQVEQVKCAKKDERTEVEITPIKKAHT